MTDQKTSINRRAFLKSSALAGGGLMISFSCLAKLGLADKVSDPDLPDVQDAARSTRLVPLLQLYLQVAP